MRRIIALILAFSFILTACASNQASLETGSSSVITSTESTSAVTQETDADIKEQPSEEVLPEESLESENKEVEETAEDVTDMAGVTPNDTEESQEAEKVKENAARYQQIEDQKIADENLDLSDERLQQYLKDKIYLEAIDSFDNDQYILDNIEITYYSQEYIDNLTYNSQENVYFGFTQAELDQQFAGKKYAFTLDEQGKTIVTAVQAYEDNTTEEVLKNVAIGSGVLLITVTVSTVTMTAAPAVGMIFAVGAKTGTAMALSGGVIGGISAGIQNGYQTGNFEDAMKAAALGASDGFKWGAITGVVSGGASETWGLMKATKNGLSMNEAAFIQKESEYPLDLIKQFKSMKEYNVYKKAHLRTQMVNGKLALVRDIDLQYKSTLPDGKEVTNLQRMKLGYAPLDPVTNKPYQLHHINQDPNGTLAILNGKEHQGNSSILNNPEIIESKISRTEFAKTRKEFWKSLGEQLSMSE